MSRPNTDHVTMRDVTADVALMQCGHCGEQHCPTLPMPATLLADRLPQAMDQGWVPRELLKGDRLKRKEYPGKGRRHVQLNLPPSEITGLRTIMGWMLQDPAHGETKIGHQSAIRYAIAHTLANPPKHVGAKG